LAKDNGVVGWSSPEARIAKYTDNIFMWRSGPWYDQQGTNDKSKYFVP
jgi:hypothetical protein